MKLLIVESPSKAKTIEKYLNGDFTVRASVGHVRDLPKSNKKAIDIEGGFIPHYEVSPGKDKVLHELTSLAKKATEIVLATDPDREGEAISWHIKELLDKEKNITSKIKRATFNEITKDAVQEALKSPREIDTKLVQAQEARRVLDRLVGYDLSGLIWKKVRYGLSAGRVQSPALRIIMEREREIRAFIPEKYWTLEGLFETKSKQKLTFTCSEEPATQERTDEILTLGKSNRWFVKDIKKSEQKRSPRAPFTTSTLQQTASTRLGFSPSRTMQVAQKLYEAGYITYMRTDSTNLSKQAQGQICAYIERKFGKNHLEARVFKTKSKNAQEAHEAIRPTHVEHEYLGNTEEQKRLYRLIWERTLSSQMSDAKLLKTKVVANVEPEIKTFPDFSVIGSQIVFLGWLTVDKDAQGEELLLPEIKQGEELKLLELIEEAKETQPPGRYTEAGLVKELESRGIGRPSTYASIIRTLEDRVYVNKQGKTLFPTDTGEVVSDFLEKNFSEYISDTFTAEMEDELDDIALGKRAYTKTLSDFYTPFLKSVKEKDQGEKATNLGAAPNEMLCPLCGNNMIVKLARTGKFYSCAKYPDCTGARKIDGSIMEGPKQTGKSCPLCREKKGGTLVVREGRFGTFISCSLYPKCKYIEKDPEEEAKKNTGIVCPTCKTGTMTERRGRFGIFYSCTNYPTCKNAIKAKPTGNICTLCHSLIMEGTKTIPERCSNNKCENHRPDKLKK